MQGEIKGNYLFKNILLKYSPFFALLMLISIFAVLSASFRSLNNLSTILFHTSVLAILGMALTLVMITGNFDLSFANVMILSNLLAAYLLRDGFSILIVFVFTLAIGAIIGCINGLVVSFLGINSIIATLGMMSILEGFISLITKGESIGIKNESFIFIGKGSIGNVPFPIIITIIIAVLLIIFTFHTKFGRHSIALGKDIDTAKFVGIKIKKITFIMFILCGLISSLGGLIEAAQNGMGCPTAGSNIMLDGFAVVFLGQGVFRPGECQIPGTLVGALLVEILSNGMTMLSIEYFTQYAIKGLIIILAVTLSMYLRKIEINVVEKKFSQVEGEAIEKN